MLQYAGAPHVPEDDSVIEMHCAEAFYSTARCLKQATQTEDKEPQMNMAHGMMQIGRHWMIMSWSEWILGS